MKKFKFFGITGLALCALCCLLPVIGGVLGAGALLSIGSKLEVVAMVLLGLSAVTFGIYFYRRNKAAKACATDCDCKS